MEKTMKNGVEFPAFYPYVDREKKKWPFQKENHRRAEPAAQERRT